MYWLQRPPYLRRVGAAALIVGAVLWDLRGTATEPYPIAARPIPVGQAVGQDDVDWVAIPAGALPVPDLGSAAAARSISEGEPLTAALFSPINGAPADWWTVPIEIGELAAPGDEVMLVVTDPPFTEFGVVVTPQSGDRYSLDYRPASVAVPPDSAALIAAAEREGHLITAARPTQGPG